MKRIIVSVTNDLVSDNRVHKICTTLTGMGFSVLLVGRKLPAGLPLKPRKYQTKRMCLLFNKGPLFYAEYNFRLFFLLLISKYDVLLSNDLDTLTANFLAARLSGKPLVYDSHEYFTEVPELIDRPRVRKTWEWLEKKMVPKVRKAYTVCDSIARIYTEKYGVPFRVVRNVPVFREMPNPGNVHKSLEKIIIYQGAVNVRRGLQQAILSMHFLENTRLVIAGDGDIKPELEEMIKTEKLEQKVKFTGRLPLEELAGLTPQADLGLSIEEDAGLNYRFALPNKLFDYTQARVPVLVSNLPEMAGIVEKYQIGLITESLQPELLAKSIQTALSDDKLRTLWRKNLETAARELNWENEEKIVKEIFSDFL